MAHRTISASVPIATEELKCTAALTPGMLCLKESTGQANVHNSAGDTAMVMVCLESEEKGDAVATATTINEQGKFGYFAPGQPFVARVANGDTVAAGDYGESNGAGYFQKYIEDSSALTIEVSNIVCRYEEAGVGVSGGTLVLCRAM